MTTNLSVWGDVMWEGLIYNSHCNIKAWGNYKRIHKALTIRGIQIDEPRKSTICPRNTSCAMNPMNSRLNNRRLRSLYVPPPYRAIRVCQLPATARDSQRSTTRFPVRFDDDPSSSISPQE